MMLTTRQWLLRWTEIRPREISLSITQMGPETEP